MLYLWVINQELTQSEVYHDIGWVISCFFVPQEKGQPHHHHQRRIQQ